MRIWVLMVTFLWFPTDALAYVDPGTTGFLYQVGYMIFYAAIGAFFFLSNHIKKFFHKIRMKFKPKETIPASEEEKP